MPVAGPRVFDGENVKEFGVFQNKTYIVRARRRAACFLAAVCFVPLVCIQNNADAQDTPAPNAAAVVRRIACNGVALKGTFIPQTQEGLYTADKPFIIASVFDIEAGMEGTAVIDCAQKKITGTLYVDMPVYGRVSGVEEITVSPHDVSFSGVIGTEAVLLSEIGVEIAFQRQKVTFAIIPGGVRIASGDGFTFSLAQAAVGRIDISPQAGASSAVMAINADTLILSGKGVMRLDDIDVACSFDQEAVMTAKQITVQGATRIFGRDIGRAKCRITKSGFVSITPAAGAISDIQLRCGVVYE